MPFKVVSNSSRSSVNSCRDVQLGAVVHDLDQIGGGHLLLDELLGVLNGANLVELLHAGHVEEHGQQPGDPCVAMWRRCRRPWRAFRPASPVGSGLDPLFQLLGRSVGVGNGRQQVAVQLLELKDADFLFLAVFEDVEVFFLEVGDRLASLVLYADVDDDQLGFAGEGNLGGYLFKSDEDRG